MKKKDQNIEKLFELKERISKLESKKTIDFLSYLFFLIPLFFLPAFGFPLLVIVCLFSAPLFIVGSLVLIISFMACLTMVIISAINYINIKKEIQFLKRGYKECQSLIN